MRASTLGPQAGQNKFEPVFTERHGLVEWMIGHLRVLSAARGGSHRWLLLRLRDRRSERLRVVRKEEKSSRFWDCHTDVAGPNWAGHEVHEPLQEARAGAHTPLWNRGRR